MTVPHKYSLIALLSIVAFILGACGAKADQTVIATSVAMTIQAEHTQEAAQATPTTAPPVAQLTLPAIASVAPGATNPPPTAPSGSQLCTASASFVSETVPDKTMMNSGAQFTKTWRIKNTGTCPWNNSWQFVYTQGDLLGAATYYQMPYVAPGDVMSMSIVLTAPAADGAYRGYWKIKSPWGMVFGDQGSGSAFWVDIAVGSGTPANNKTQTAYSVTNVSYESDVTLIRRCTTANTFYDYIAYITTDGPLTISYRFNQSDGNNSNHGSLNFSGAATKSVTATWSQNRASSTNPRWIQLVVTTPVYYEYPKFTLPPLCW